MSEKKCFISLLLICCVFSMANAENGVTTPVTLPSSLLHRKIVMCSTLIEPQFPMNLMYNFFGLSQFEKIDLNMCSHLNFVDLELSKLKEPWKEQTCGMDYERAKLLRKKHPHIKILLGIYRNRHSFSALTKPANREQFIKLLINSIVKYKLDGLNLMFENSLHDKNAELLNEMSVHIKAHQLLLAVSFPMDSNHKSNEFNYAAISNHVDFMQIFNTNSINKAINLGTPRQKIIFGISTKATHDVSHLIDLFDVNTYMYSMRYDEICQLMSTANILSKTFDSKSEKMLIKYIDQANTSHTLKFESTRTVANKTRFAVKQNLGGVGLYLLDGDDAYGKCSIEQDTYVDFETANGVTLNIPPRRNNAFPLIRAINEAILITIDELHQRYALMNKSKQTNANANANANTNENTSNSFDWMQLLNGLATLAN